MIKSLYSKFAVTTILIMLVSSLIAFLISNTYYQHQIKPYNDEKNTKIALEITHFFNRHQEISLIEYLEHIAALGYQMYIVDEHGGEQYIGAHFRSESLPPSVVKQVLAGEIYHGMASFPQETFVTGFFANELRNTIGVPLQVNNQAYALFIRPDIRLLFSEVHTLLGWILWISIILSILLVLINTKFLVEPISKLTMATREIAQGNFSVQLDIDREDELGELAKSFSQMVDQLGQMEEMRKEFISNISHDIQSPLATIQGYSKLLEKESLQQEEKQKYIHVIYTEARRLSNLTKQYLLLASLDRNEEAFSKKTCNIMEQWKELIHNYQWLINERGIMLTYALPSVELTGDPGLLYVVWENLLTNAIKYNKEDGEISISLQETEEQVKVVVQDKGIGLTEAELARIFERFYRVDAARTRSVEGTGLGLAVVQMIVRMHGGAIQASSEKNQGSTFTITLPKM